MSQDIRIIHLAGTPSVVTICQGPAGPIGPIDETVAANLAEEVTARVAGDEALATAIANEASFRAAADTTAAAAATSALTSHTSRTDNPHSVTKSQIGLANVPNTDATQRANHTGTQTLSTISDAGTAASLNIGTSAGNVPVLDGTAKLPVSTIPAIAITDYLGAVANQSAMLALTGQKGDWCTRTDEGKTYVITGPDPSLIAGWSALSYPAAPVISVAGKTGTVTLSISDITSLQSSLNAKQPLDTDLTAIAQLGGSGFLYRDSGNWQTISSSTGGNAELDSGAVVVYDSDGHLTATTDIRAVSLGRSVQVALNTAGNGSIVMLNNGRSALLTPPALTEDISWNLPATEGTLALTSDITGSTGGNGYLDGGRLAEYDVDGTLTSSFGITLSDPNVGFRMRFTPGDDNLTSDRVILIPDADGTMALTSDLASYIGSTSINTVGTISDGVSYWQANPIGTPYGGTGMDNGALPANRFLYTTSTGTFTAGTITSAGRALIDDADAAAQRATLGLSSLATTTPASGITTFLSSPTSANLRAALTDETGTGAAVFADSPNLISPTIAQINTGAGQLLVSGTGASGSMRLQGTGSSGYSSFDLLNASGAQTGGFGYANPSAGAYADKVYLYTAGKDFILGNSAGGTNFTMSGSNGSITVAAGTNLSAFVIASANTSVDTMTVKGISSSGYASIGFIDSGNVQRGSFGYGNSSAGSYQSSIFFQAGAGVPFALGAGGLERMRIGATGGISIGTSTDPGGANLLVAGTTSTSGLTTTTLSASGQVEFNGQSATNATSAMTRLLSGQLSGSALPLLGYTLPNALHTYNGSSQTTHVITIRPSGYVDNTITASSARTKGSYGEILASGTGADFLINSGSGLTNPETAVIVFRCTADSTSNGIVRYRSFNVMRGSGNAYVYFNGSAATVTSSSIAASTSTLCVAVFSGDGSISRYHLKAGANKVSGSWNDTSNAGDSAGAGYIQANAGHGGIANGVEFVGGFLFAGKASANQLEALAEHYYGLFA